MKDKTAARDLVLNRAKPLKKKNMERVRRMQLAYASMMISKKIDIWHNHTYQMPCPVVHPLPSLVPKPTKNPPTMNPSGETIGMVASPYPRR